MHDQPPGPPRPAPLLRPSAASHEARQRWRLTFSRGDEARFLAHSDAVKLWDRAVRTAELPIVMAQGSSPRGRFVFAAPLPVGMTAEREIADMFLFERLRLRDLRDRLDPHVPTGHGLVDLYDVWVGEPSLASHLAGADYEVAVSGADRATIESAVEWFLAAESVVLRGGREARATASNVRALVLAVEARGWVDAPGGGGTGTLWTRMRHDPQLGTGRPEELVAALARTAGPTDRPDHELDITGSTRLRLWFREELGAGPSA